MFNAPWIVGSDVATTWMSRIAMNMPRHIMENPTHVRNEAGVDVSVARSEVISFQAEKLSASRSRSGTRTIVF